MSLSYLQGKYFFTDIIDLADRVSTHISQNEPSHKRQQWQQTFFNAISRKEFMPSGNTLSGSGISNQTTPTTTPTLQPNCSVIGEINNENQEEIKQRARRLWEKAIGIGFFINTSDPVQTLEELSQINDSIPLWENRPKRGNMAVVSIDHPRFFEVATYKANHLTQLYNFNISVAITNEFMSALQCTDKEWKQSGKTAKEWLMIISEHCWKCGDPGMVFIDRVQNSNPETTRQLGRIKTAVPCGEQFLHDNETCNLGVVNLNAPTLFNEKNGQIRWKRLKRVVSIGIRFLDNVIDLLEIPDKEMKELSLKCRRVGLGIAGWADLLHKCNIPYNSAQALNLADTVSQFVTAHARITSMELAQEKGECPYRPGFRNISLTCIQPTGGITSLLGNQGYCIEPFFHQANQLSYQDHIEMQSRWQRNMEQGISKTINMANSATVQDIYNAYVMAFEKNCKGITAYRDDCRNYQPIKCKSCEEEGMCPLVK